MYAKGTDMSQMRYTDTGQQNPMYLGQQSSGMYSAGFSPFMAKTGFKPYTAPQPQANQWSSKLPPGGVYQGSRRAPSPTAPDPSGVNFAPWNPTVAGPQSMPAQGPGKAQPAQPQSQGTPYQGGWEGSKWSDGQGGVGQMRKDINVAMVMPREGTPYNKFGAFSNTPWWANGNQPSVTKYSGGLGGFNPGFDNNGTPVDYSATNKPTQPSPQFNGFGDDMRYFPGQGPSRPSQPTQAMPQRQNYTAIADRFPDMFRSGQAQPTQQSYGTPYGAPSQFGAPDSDLFMETVRMMPNGRIQFG